MRQIDADALENELQSRLEKEGDEWMASWEDRGDILPRLTAKRWR